MDTLRKSTRAFGNFLKRSSKNSVASWEEIFHEDGAKKQSDGQ